MSGSSEETIDVLICGGGAAGLTLALHLRRSLPDLKVVVLEKTQGELPAAACKVGESVNEAASHYMSETLGIKDYLEKNHLVKMGLRYFFGPGTDPLEKRPELGPHRFVPWHVYQLDRGVFENDLRKIVIAAGADVRSGCAVEDIELTKDGSPHTVSVRSSSGQTRLKARWVVDALGRRRLIQSKLGLKRANGHVANSVWCRIPRQVDIEDMVDRSNRAWHRRVPGKVRHLSTNHLMGKGYWLWIIPLSSKNTSIGLVFEKGAIDFKEVSSYEKFRAWIRLREPGLDPLLGDSKPLDFKGIEDYSYAGAQSFSAQRWTCVGDAATFLDPFYSPSLDMIALGNSMTVEMIRQDNAGTLSVAHEKFFNLLFSGINESFMDLYRGCYPIFGNCHVMTAKIIWDFAVYVGYLSQVIIHEMFSITGLSSAEKEIFSKLPILNKKIQVLFQEWAAKTPERRTFDFFEPLTQTKLLRPLFYAMRRAKSPRKATAHVLATQSILESLALVLFQRAVQDVLPEKTAFLKKKGWLNAWAISLDSSRWESDGLFAPTTPPRDLTEIDADLAQVLGPGPLAKKAKKILRKPARRAKRRLRAS